MEGRCPPSLATAPCAASMRRTSMSGRAWPQSCPWAPSNPAWTQQVRACSCGRPPGHLPCGGVRCVILTSRCLVPTVKLREGGQSLEVSAGGRRLSSVRTFVCSLVGGGRGEECGVEADAPPSALPQPVPTPAPVLAPHQPILTPTPSVVPSLFPTALQPSVPLELPAKPAPVYSDAVRGFPGQAPRSSCAHGVLVHSV